MRRAEPRRPIVDALVSAGDRVRIVVLLVVALAGTVALVGPEDPAGADTTTPPASAETVGECAAADEVWLHIETESGEVLRSECVGSPTTGRDALAEAEVATTRATGGYFCTLAGHPHSCPRRFSDAYWQYWHAGSVDDPWVFAERGADTRRPVPGGLEGWCYKPTDAERCTLPTLAVDHPAAPRIDKQPPSSNAGVWTDRKSVV